MSETRRLNGRLQHQKLRDRDVKLRPNATVPPSRDATLGEAWSTWLASERERRGSPNWTPFW